MVFYLSLSKNNIMHRKDMSVSLSCTESVYLMQIIHSHHSEAALINTNTREV